MLVRTLLFVCASFSSAWACAQEWPQKPVRVVVNNSAGSLTDVVARIVFSKVSEMSGQQFFIDDRPGAGGIIGAELVAKSSADGYTLLVSSDGVFTINPFIYAS